jgi:hypothetical protein
MIETRKRYCAGCGRAIGEGTYCERVCESIARLRANATVMPGPRRMLSRERLLKRIDDECAKSNTPTTTLEFFADARALLKAWPWDDTFGMTVTSEQRAAIECVLAPHERGLFAESCAKARRVDFKGGGLERNGGDRLVARAKALIEAHDYASLRDMRMMVEALRDEHVPLVLEAWGVCEWGNYGRPGLRARLYADTAMDRWLDLVAFREAGIIRKWCPAEDDAAFRARLLTFPVSRCPR